MLMQAEIPILLVAQLVETDPSVSTRRTGQKFAALFRGQID